MQGIASLTLPCEDFGENLRLGWAGLGSAQPQPSPSPAPAQASTAPAPAPRPRNFRLPHLIFHTPSYIETRKMAGGLATGHSLNALGSLVGLLLVVRLLVA